MKTKIALIASLLCIFGLSAQAQLAFSVSPGIGLNSASLGFQTGNLVPFIGIQAMSANGSITMETKEYDGALGQVVDKEYNNTGKVTAIVPTIGVKYFFSPQGQIKPYVIISITKPMLSGKAEQDGEEIEEFSDAIKEVKLFGGEAGFGCEFFPADNFSVGAEFGFRMMRGNYTDEYDDSVYNPNTMQNVDFTGVDTYKASLTPTFTRITLNFYFNSSGSN